MVSLSKTPTHRKGPPYSLSGRSKSPVQRCQVGRQVGLHLGYGASEPREGRCGHCGRVEAETETKGGPTHGCTCEPRREEGNRLTLSTGQAVAPFRAPSPALAPALWRVGASRRWHRLCPGTGAHGPDLAAASGGREGLLEPEPALPSGPGPDGRSRGVRSGPGRRGDGKVTGRRRPRPGAATSALPLASQSAQYLLSSSLSSLDRMSWCCSFSF